jgi:hypothetical protein
LQKLLELLKLWKFEKEKMLMRKTLVVLGIVAMCAAAGFPATVPLVVTNDDNPAAGGNTASVYHLNTNTGAMTLIKVLATGGSGLGSGYFANTGTAVESNAHCVFVANTGSDTISWFEGPSYVLGGSAGIPGMFSTFGLGGSIALSPNGRVLASGNSGTMNVSTWRVATNCALTLVGSYVPSIGPDYFSPLGFTPDNHSLVVPAPNLSGAEIFKVHTNGTLLDVNNVTWPAAACTGGCYPTGLDFTNNSGVVVFGNASLGQTSVLTANIAASTLSSPLVFNIANIAGTLNPNVPYFSQAGAAGNGELFVGMSGAPFSTGEVTTNFTSIPTIAVSGLGNAVTTGSGYMGAIRTYGATGVGAGGMMVMAVYPNILQPAKIGAGGVITLLAPTIDVNGVGLLSISIYPATR